MPSYIFAFISYLTGPDKKTFLTSLFGQSEHALSQNFKTVNWRCICSGIHSESPIKATLGAVFPSPKKKLSALCWIWLSKGKLLHAHIAAVYSILDSTNV